MISCLAASSRASGWVGEEAKPRVWGEALSRPFSIASVALNARMLMLFIISSIRAYRARQHV